MLKVTIDKPLFITKSGIQHQAQESMLNALLGLDHLEGVIWFFKENSEKYFGKRTEYPYTVFKDTGLYTDTGEKNPGALIWEETVGDS